MRVYAGVISAIVILILLIPIGLPIGDMGYNIQASVGDTAWSIGRYTNQLSFSFNDSIYGKGNISRYRNIEPNSDLNYLERSSVVRNGSLSLSEALVSKVVEGPVSISYGMKSVINSSDQELNREYEQINIEESWPFFFIDHKGIKYAGPGIRTLERYESLGDSISSYSDSWNLNKESAFRTLNNRTKISVNLTPQGLIRERYSNKKLSYELGVESTGSKEELDVIRTVPFDERSNFKPGNIIARINQEYVGQVKMQLSIESNETVPYKRDILNNSLYNISEDNYLPCCLNGELNNQSILNPSESCNYTCLNI